MHNFAMMYQNGVGVEEDQENAARLFLAAAYHGLPESQFLIAIRLIEGNGVEVDLIDAYAWLATAADSGHGDARNVLRDLNRDWDKKMLSLGRDRAKEIARDIKEMSAK